MSYITHFRSNLNIHALEDIQLQPIEQLIHALKLLIYDCITIIIRSEWFSFVVKTRYSECKNI